MSESFSHHITVSINKRCLTHESPQGVWRYPINIARLGIDQREGSYKTPLGLHYIRAKIGAGLPSGAILRGRRFTGECYREGFAAQYPEKDWILTRILWLCGREVGWNRLGNCDTFWRYVYIHGCPDEYPMGSALSRGCIQMRNADLITFFERVPCYALVDIQY